MQFNQEHPLLVIGGGNMGTALATRWAKWSPVIVESSSLRRASLKDEGFTTYESLADVQTLPSVIVLAVKPQSYGEIKSAIAKWSSASLFVSIMAGIPLSGLPVRAARVMPNTPALIGQAMSVCCAPQLSDDDKRAVNDLFAACGEVAWVEDESALHAVTAISGSGPAYVFAFMEAFEKAAIDLGLDAATAHTLIKQTVLGAVGMTNVPFADFALLREQVTSKGGTTEAALAELLPKLPGILRDAVKAAEARSKSLASQ